MDVCGRIDDDIIELHAMGRLKHGPVRRHLESCGICRARVDDQSLFIERIKRALEDFDEERAPLARNGSGQR